MFMSLERFLYVRELGELSLLSCQAEQYEVF